MSEREERLQALYREWRQWLWRHPHKAVWRAALWFYWKRVPPWQLTVSMLAWVNPVPLRGAALRGLCAMTEERIAAPEEREEST